MIDNRMENPITEEIALKLTVASQSFREKPTDFCLETRFFQGENKDLNKLGMEKK